MFWWLPVSFHPTPSVNPFLNDQCNFPPRAACRAPRPDGPGCLSGAPGRSLTRMRQPAAIRCWRPRTGGAHRHRPSLPSQRRGPPSGHPAGAIGAPPLSEKSARFRPGSPGTPYPTPPQRGQGEGTALHVSGPLPPIFYRRAVTDLSRPGARAYARGPSAAHTHDGFLIWVLGWN